MTSTDMSVDVRPVLAVTEANVDALWATCDFTVKLKRKQPERWGLELGRSKADGQLFITRPSGRPIDEWHAANPSKIVKACDEIIAVNGVSEKAAMVEELKTATEIQVLLRRQTRWTVELLKTGPLGLRVRPGTLTIGMIADGIISEYNATCHPSLTVCTGDQLVAINTKKMDSSQNLQEIFDKLSDGVEIKFVFVRESLGAETVKEMRSQDKSEVWLKEARRSLVERNATIGAANNSDGMASSVAKGDVGEFSREAIVTVVITCEHVVDEAACPVVKCRNVGGEQILVCAVPADEEPYGRWLLSEVTKVTEQTNTRLVLVDAAGEILWNGGDLAWEAAQKPVAGFGYSMGDLFGLDVKLPDGDEVRIEQMTETTSCENAKRAVLEQARIAPELRETYILFYYGMYMGDEFQLNAFGIPWNGTQLELKAKADLPGS